MTYKIGDHVLHNGCIGVIREVLTDQTTKPNGHELYLVHFGEAGNFRLFDYELVSA